MLSAWIVGALVFGTLAWRLGLPPLVGFLLSGFFFGALGGEPTESLHELADAGVLLLLFAVGLKLRFKTLIRSEVWATAVLHLIVIVAISAPLIRFGVAPGWTVAVILAITLGFSSTVLAAKSLEAQFELRSFHGRITIGILIIQDLVAVSVLAFVNAQVPSPWALSLLLLPFARPVLHWLLDYVGHGELLVLFGAVLAIAVGGAGFAYLGLSAELGALLLGALLTGHKRAEELSTALWGLKEFLLVGFFLSIGLSQTPTWDTLVYVGWLLLLLPIKATLLFGLLLLFGLRARTSFLTTLNLATYSEFALIVTSGAAEHGLFGKEWLVVAAVTVAISFVVAAQLTANSHTLYQRFAPWLERFERQQRRLDDEPITLGSAEILIVGMGRLGTGAYDYLHEAGQNVVGTDSDLGKVERHLSEGRRVVYADADDDSLWQTLHVDRLKAIMLAFPDLDAKCVAGRALRRRGYAGLLTATHVYAEEREPILEAGADATFNYFTEAGVGFARDTVDAVRK
jgi:predicted Kef-type K+ transport protein